MVCLRSLMLSVCALLASGLSPAWGGAGGLPYNRAIHASDVRVEPNPEPTPGRPFMVTGILRYEVEPIGTLDLSCTVEVFINGVYAGGGPGGGVTCGDPGTTQKITFGPGIPIGGNPPLFDCAIFCAECFGSDFNLCTPPNISPGPLCMCQQECLPFRVTGFGVPVAELAPDDLIEIVLSRYDTGLPEIHTSDDTVALLARDATPCPADLDGNRVLDLGDINLFIAGFISQDPIADLAPPFGVFDLADANAFVTAFLAGCP